MIAWAILVIVIAAVALYADGLWKKENKPQSHREHRDFRG